MAYGPLQRPPDDATAAEYSRGYTDARRRPNDPAWQGANNDAWLGVGVLDGLAKRKPRIPLGPKPVGRYADNYSAAYAGVLSGVNKEGLPLSVAPDINASAETFWADQGAMDAISGAGHRLGLETSVEKETEIVVISPTGGVTTAPKSAAEDYPESLKIYKYQQAQQFDASKIMTALLLSRLVGKRSSTEKPKKKKKKKGKR